MSWDSNSFSFLLESHSLSFSTSCWASSECTKPFFFVAFKTMALGLMLACKHQCKFEVDIGLHTGGSRIHVWGGSETTLFQSDVELSKVNWVASGSSNTVLVFGCQEDIADMLRIVSLHSSVPG